MSAFFWGGGKGSDLKSGRPEAKQERKGLYYTIYTTFFYKLEILTLSVQWR